MVVVNTLFKKDIHKYTWMRQDIGRVVDRAMMDYVIVLKNIIGRLLDVGVFSFIKFNRKSDHADPRVQIRWSIHNLEGKGIQPLPCVGKTEGSYEVCEY